MWGLEESGLAHPRHSENVAVGSFASVEQCPRHDGFTPRLRTYCGVAAKRRFGPIPEWLALWLRTRRSAAFQGAYDPVVFKELPLRAGSAEILAGSMGSRHCRRQASH